MSQKRFCIKCGKTNDTYTDLCNQCLDEMEIEDNDHPISQDDMTYPEEIK